MTTTPWADEAWFLRAAVAQGWDVVAQKGNVIIDRGPERIEIEIGSAGLPRNIKRTEPDGTNTTIGQTFIVMADVLKWLDEPKEAKDE